MKRSVQDESGIWHLNYSLGVKDNGRMPPKILGKNDFEP